MTARGWISAMIVLFCALSTPARAQLRPDFKFYLFENDRRVGEVFVPERATDATDYLEHWVLYPGYVYPGRQNRLGLQIRAALFEKPYSDLNDFLARVPWKKGSKYIRVRAREFRTLPITALR